MNKINNNKKKNQGVARNGATKETTNNGRSENRPQNESMAVDQNPPVLMNAFVTAKSAEVLQQSPTVEAAAKTLSNLILNLYLPI